MASFCKFVGKSEILKEINYHDDFLSRKLFVFFILFCQFRFQDKALEIESSQLTMLFCFYAVKYEALLFSR
jgi:hypothetical protein